MGPSLRVSSRPQTGQMTRGEAHSAPTSGSRDQQPSTSEATSQPPSSAPVSPQEPSEAQQEDQDDVPITPLLKRVNRPPGFSHGQRARKKSVGSKREHQRHSTNTPEGAIRRPRRGREYQRRARQTRYHQTPTSPYQEWRQNSIEHEELPEPNVYHTRARTRDDPFIELTALDNATLDIEEMVEEATADADDDDEEESEWVPVGMHHQIEQNIEEDEESVSVPVSPSSPAAPPSPSSSWWDSWTRSQTPKPETIDQGTQTQGRGCSRYNITPAASNRRSYYFRTSTHLPGTSQIGHESCSPSGCPSPSLEEETEVNVDVEALDEEQEPSSSRCSGQRRTRSMNKSGKNGNSPWGKITRFRRQAILDDLRCRISSIPFRNRPVPDTDDIDELSHELKMRLASQAPILEQLLDPVTGQLHIRQTTEENGQVLHFLVPNLSIDGEQDAVIVSSSKVHITP